MNSALMFSKASDEWSTPDRFFAELHLEFHFTFDAAATVENKKTASYFGPDHVDPTRRDALTRTWKTVGTIWLNPPYSKCREFMAKAAQTARDGDATVVCLVPSRTDTRWWHEHVWDRDRHTTRSGVEIRFVKGRLTFGGAPAGAPFPSVVIIFRPEPDREPR